MYRELISSTLTHLSLSPRARCAAVLMCFTLTGCAIPPSAEGARPTVSNTEESPATMTTPGINGEGGTIQRSGGTRSSGKTFEQTEDFKKPFPAHEEPTKSIREVPFDLSGGELFTGLVGKYYFKITCNQGQVVHPGWATLIGTSPVLGETPIKIATALTIDGTPVCEDNKIGEDEAPYASKWGNEIITAYGLGDVSQ